MMKKLLLDECISPYISPRFWEHDVDAIHARDRGLIRTEDHVLWNYAMREDRALVTINARHFKPLWEAEEIHPGLVVIPNGLGRDRQFDSIMTAVNWVGMANSRLGFTNRYFEVSVEGGLTVVETHL